MFKFAAQVNAWEVFFGWVSLILPLIALVVIFFFTISVVRKIKGSNLSSSEISSWIAWTLVISIIFFILFILRLIYLIQNSSQFPQQWELNLNKFLKTLGIDNWQILILMCLMIFLYARSVHTTVKLALLKKQISDLNYSLATISERLDIIETVVVDEETKKQKRKTEQRHEELTKLAKEELRNKYKTQIVELNEKLKQDLKEEEK